MKINIRFWSYLAQFLWWKVFQTRVVEKIKKNTFYGQFFFPFENRAIYEIMWKNIVDQERSEITIRRMRISR